MSEGFIGTYLMHISIVKTIIGDGEEGERVPREDKVVRGENNQRNIVIKPIGIRVLINELQKEENLVRNNF